METRPIKSITIEFEDGTVEHHDLPVSAQGFYRERYTYQQRESDRKIEHKLYVHEVHWTIKGDA